MIPAMSHLPLLAAAVCSILPATLTLTTRAAPVDTQGLPATVISELLRAQLPPQALSAVVQDVESLSPRLSWQAQQSVNPASLFKLITTFAALDLLGPAFTWTTQVWLLGQQRDGVLDGSVVIKGNGDPKLVVERVLQLLRRVRQLGVREIRGDIVLDRAAFAAEAATAADFDGEPHRPYNVRPDALLLSHKSVTYTFTPDRARGVATIAAEPALHGLTVDREVALSAGPCEDWRAMLGASPSDPLRMRFEGSYPARCGERNWALAYADAASYNARLLRALWTELGGKLDGSVRDGTAPNTPPSFEMTSPPLADVVRDINKFSNNVMAQQLFLTLSARSPASTQAARQVLVHWLHQRLPQHAADVVVDNGSGLSREQRVSAAALAALLQVAWRSPVMPELMSSLPVSGLDGTLRRAQAATGRAHLKTGSLRDVVALAGYVTLPSGKRRILVAIIQHPQAQAGRGALEALLQWTAEEHPKTGPSRPSPAGIKERGRATFPSEQPRSR